MHDKNGVLLHEGDIVTLKATVVTLHGNPEFCNVTIETVEPMYPSDRKDKYTVNTRQIEKIS
jgi:hypothetical protein